MERERDTQRVGRGESERGLRRRERERGKELKQKKIFTRVIDKHVCRRPNKGCIL